MGERQTLLHAKLDSHCAAHRRLHVLGCSRLATRVLLSTMPLADVLRLCDCALDGHRSPATLRSRLEAARKTSAVEVKRCMKEQQQEYNAFKKRLFDVVQQCSGLD